jgi:hypothetical protein
MEVIFQDPIQSDCCITFNHFNIIQMLSFGHVLDVGKQKQVAGGKIWRVGWMFHNIDISICQKLLYSEGRTCRHIVVMLHHDLCYVMIVQ